MNHKTGISGKLYISATILVISTLLVTSFIWTQSASALPELPSMTLTVVGWDGRVVTLNETQIGELTSYRAYGGYRNQLGIVKGLGYYTGVPFTTLCDLAGGILPGDTVKVTAPDGFIKTFTYSEVFGNFVTYYPNNGTIAPHSQPLIPIFAYYYNDQLLTDGPLKTAVVGPEGLATGSTYWVKYASKMEIIPGPISHASINIDPDTLNLKSNGKWITAYIQPDEGNDAANIDASSVLLNGQLSPILDPKYGFVTDPNEYLVDSNSDGVMERMVKFSRTDIVSLIYMSTMGMVRGSFTMTMTGKFNDGTRFKGVGAMYVLWTVIRAKAPCKR